ncbi:hypothetical protein [Acetobacter oeni]|uniref:Uncharacterized protein n=1 Tax=Acetobacter oeni TaxID=304077 RepID=A0A511XPQ1_9PROT|nr:hypothetical protein [Acetobacter oeni]MBB3884663.1 hypothetical protein [Acetobacter oeni]NHO20610.1 hypothetical protein [Acetobacter oeni]GBR06191.1 hypothetical protein AA21952_1947 [Acetobacter oeni LMG 21952]GEN64931.1 hypothetical protein AOE01nite_31550 [Acetobacter oeni]
MRNKTDIQPEGFLATGIVRTQPERLRRQAAQIFATCAMGAWIALAVVPFVVVLVELG